MKLPENKNRTALSSLGVAGNVVLSGVVFNALSPYWLMLAVVLILMGIGIENGSSKSS
jgi:hypothetical protein